MRLMRLMRSSGVRLPRPLPKGRGPQGYQYAFFTSSCLCSATQGAEHRTVGGRMAQKWKMAEGLVGSSAGRLLLIPNDSMNREQSI
jgi:hypothetical protein